MRKGIPPRIFYHQPQGKPIFSAAQVKRRKPVRRHTGRSTIVAGSAFPSPPKGEEFIASANEFLRLEARTLALRQTAGSASGTLRLGVLESLFVWKIADLLPQYHSKYPGGGMTIGIKSATDAALYRMLRQNELDIIYLLDNVVYHKDCVRACTSPISLKFIADRKMNCAAGKISLLRRLRKNP